MRLVNTSVLDQATLGTTFLTEGKKESVNVVLMYVGDSKFEAIAYRLDESKSVWTEDLSRFDVLHGVTQAFDGYMKDDWDLDQSLYALGRAVDSIYAIAERFVEDSSKTHKDRLDYTLTL